MPVPRLLHRMPAHVLNGVGVALGIALIQLVAGTLGGAAAVLSASTGAVYASLADLPNAPSRTWRRVLTAAVIGCIVSLLAGALRPLPLLLGVFVGLLGFVSALMLAWGLRAGPISFVGILAFVFTMAAPAPAGFASMLAHTGWTALGAGLYVAWAVAAAALLQPRYRTLSLAAVLEATARLLRSRAGLLAENPRRFDGAPPLQLWIRDEAALDGSLQTARDLLFAATDSTATQRQTALLLLAIDLRDTLLLSQLDLDLLGHDGPGEQVRHGLAASLNAMADALDGMQEALRLTRPLPPSDATELVLSTLMAAVVFPAGDVRLRLMPVMLDRARHMIDDLNRMQALMRGADAQVPLGRAELQLFVSVEGWPLAALRPHASLRSPVLRHAVRFGAALGSAYFIARMLPWASHPYWLVLSVAVVLRGNLEQTLSRRNARVAGTMTGCVLVLGLAQLGAPWLSNTVFLVATGVAHTFVTVRYFVTSAAATVMALLQAHLAHPLAGFAVWERMADTVLGAVLAWGFSYVLPSWEKRGLSRLVARVRRTLAALTAQALRPPDASTGDLALRLARREVYDALGSVAATAQRTGSEPERVRVPLYALATVLAQSHALLAHLAAVKVMLARRAGELDREATEAALQAAAADMARWLSAKPEPGASPTPPFAADEVALPPQAPAASLMPWLQRRLQMATLAAARVSQAAAALEAAGA